MFLWEYAIKHAVYLRERAPAKALPGSTPYEAWHRHKPDISSTRPKDAAETFTSIKTTDFCRL